MSFGRWAVTASVMGVAAWMLHALGPGWPEVRSAVTDPQGLVDRAGADALVLVAVPVLAWLCWGWGALGLLLTAATTLPGAVGRHAGAVLTVALPAGARRAAAVALGLTLSTAAPVLSPLAGLPVALASATEVVPDWPSAPPPGVPSAPALPPDWPQAGPADHVVVRGDCLWDIAADWLRHQTPDAAVTDAAVQHAVAAWWQANAAVIGPDPDLLLPGQVLRPPA